MVDIEIGLNGNSGWQIVNDDVMGGISQSQFTVFDGVGIFKGEVSPENNGGFASCRIIVETGTLSGAGGLSVRVKGDGNRYQLRVRMSDNSADIAYAIYLEAEKEQWQDHSLNFNDFKPVYRGQFLDDAPALVPAHIQQIGFLIADEQFGGFELSVAGVKGIAL